MVLTSTQIDVLFEHSPAIRDALLRCLDDEDEDVREEAAVGLGKRHDERLLPKLIVMLDEHEVGLV